MTTVPIKPGYRNAIWTAIVLQLLLTIFLITILDGGRLARIGACTLVAFWAGAAVIVLRRPNAPRPIDLHFIRWGCVPMLLLAIEIANVVYHGGA